MKPYFTSNDDLRHNRAAIVIAAIVLCIPGALFNLWPLVNSWNSWGVDFNQFYSASRLAGTGHVYDWEALRKVEHENGAEEPIGRLPVEAFAIKVLNGLPYRTARFVWLGASVAALLLFGAFWPGAGRWPMMGALIWSMPAAVGLLYGQDTAFWVMFFAGGLTLLERKKPCTAGVVFSLCICKFHLALGIPIMLAAQKRWRALFAGMLATLALTGACFWIEGPGWVRQYAAMMRMPEFSPASERMPNLHGLASWFSWPDAIEIACAMGLVWLLWVVCRDNADIGMTGAAAAGCGLLLGHHGYGGDCLLLLPLAVLTLQRQGVPITMKAWAILVLSPLPPLLLISDKSFLGQIFVAAFVVIATATARPKPLDEVALATCTALQDSV